MFLRGFRITVRDGLAAARMGPIMISSVADAGPADFDSETRTGTTRGASGRSWFANLFNRSGRSFGWHQQQKLLQKPLEVAVEQFPVISEVLHCISI